MQKISQFSAALATGLLLATTYQLATAQEPIYKCLKGNQTTYSSSPCPKGAKANTVEMHHAEGFVRPSEETINAADQRIKARAQDQETRTTTTTTTYRTTTDNKAACASLKNEATQLDSASRQQQSGWSQDQIRFRKQDVIKEQYRLKCS